MLHRYLAVLFCLLSFTYLLNGQTALIDHTTGIKGSLVIAGGAMEPDNRDVYNKLITLAGGPNDAVFAVIPAAGGVPMQSFILFRSTLLGYGVKPENIHLIPIAVIDDDSTQNIDESLWKNNATDVKLAAKIRTCSAVWFTGGDQARITKTLYAQDGIRTPVLQAVWDVYARGGVIGGTSAGAAMMSDPMIGSGTSMRALVYKGADAENGNSADDDADDTLQIAKGMGFFDGGLVDQHFEVRARIGRLITALNNIREKSGSTYAFSGTLTSEVPLFNHGFGVDENTALIYYPQRKTIEAAGASGITIVDISQAKFRKHTPAGSIDRTFAVENVYIGYLTNGDAMDLTTGSITPAADKKNITGDASANYSHEESDLLQGGILVPRYKGLTDLLTGMADCSGCAQVSNLNFFTDALAYRVTLMKLPDFAGYRNEQHEKYTVKGVRLDMEPVQISVRSLK